jgi:diguanylate cyclase (GGDEF)-like protein
MTGSLSEIIGPEIRLLLVDDDEHYLTATQALLVSEGYHVAVAHDAREALEILHVTPIDVALVDYSLPEISGGDLVSQIRARRSDIRIILQTGSIEGVPEREILHRLDVHGLVDKSDGPERLLLWTEVAAKAAIATRRIRQDAISMKMVAQVAAGFHRMEPVAQLGSVVLSKVCECLGAARGILVLYSDVLGSSDEALEIHPGRVGVSIAAQQWGTGTDRWPDCATSAELALARLAVKHGRPQVDGQCVIMPLVVRDTCLGFICIADATASQIHADWLALLAYQASVAIQNAIFYEMAAFDELSGLHARRFFENWARRELHASLRNGTRCGLLYADLDGLKRINDTAGHLYGDAAIRATGAVLRSAVREHDIVGRLGGDEFAMLLPATEEEGAVSVGERILELLAEERIETPDGPVVPTVSIGIVVLSLSEPCDPRVARKFTKAFYDDMWARLMIRADEALYQAKASGGGRVCVGPPVQITTYASERPSGQVGYEIA